MDDADRWVAILDDVPEVGRAAVRLLGCAGAIDAMAFTTLGQLRDEIERRGPPALLVLDHDLGQGGTGLDALAALRADGVGASVVLWTAASTTLVRREARRLGHRDIDVLEKVPSGSLLSWVRRHLYSSCEP